MSAQNELNTASKPGPETASDMQVDIRKHQVVDCPSVEQVLSESAVSLPPLSAKGTESLSAEEQASLFSSLQDAFRNSEGGGEAAIEALKDVRAILDKLWQGNSEYLVQAADVLANGSRNPSRRGPYGQTGILDFFLRLTASSEVIDNGLLLHSLRLVGNSCADTDENRSIVTKDNYTLAVMRRLLNPGLTHVVIPVVYNTCMDFEPGQTQAAENRIAYVLLKLIKDGVLSENEALLDFAYELIELAAEQGKGIERSPDGTILLLTELALDKDLTLAQFSCLVNSLMKYLENGRFQNVCMSNGLVEGLLPVLQRSFSIKVDRSSVEEAKLLVQLQLKINQALGEVSGSESFAKFYPLDSSLIQTLKSWLTSGEDQLQICACVMLGNLARSDEVCEIMVHKLGLHKELISILNSDARGGVLHGSLSFLKNLAIAGSNRQSLGEAGLVPAIACLWDYDTVPQVQFAATSIARQLIRSSIENVSRLLDILPPGGDEPEAKLTYLSLLLALFGKTDSAPIKTEIGRIVASICRTLSPMTRESHDTADSANVLLDRLFTLHETISHPIAAMITQDQWPVVRSEGWFCLTLIATNEKGGSAAVGCLQDVFPLLEKTLSTDDVDSTDDAGKLKQAKDRDNIIILVQELLSRHSDRLSEEMRDSLEDLMKNHVPRHLKESQKN